MMRSLTIIALGSAAMFSAAQAVSQPAEDHPCVQELCIGDGLDKLRTIDWQTVAYTSERVTRIRKEDRARRAKVFPGFGADGVPSYLIVGKFDRDLIGSMASVSAACAPNGLEGTFISEGGHKTIVTVSLLPTTIPERMMWRVTSISRIYSGMERPSDRGELNQALNAKYARFVNRQPGESGVLIAPLGKETVLTLHWVDVDRDRKFGSHPQCEKPKKLVL